MSKRTLKKVPDREADRLAEVVENSELPFSMTRHDGSYIMVNDAYVRLVGYSRAELLDGGVRWSVNLTPPEWRPIQVEKLAEMERTRRAVCFEKEYILKDGRRLPVEIFAQPTYDADGGFRHFCVFTTDISDRQNSARSMQQSVSLAEQAARSKSEFLAVMSHEIRTPMNTIIGFTNLVLADPEITPRIKSRMDIIERSSAHLLELLNNILEASRIERGRLELRLSEFSVAEMLADTLRMFEVQAAAKNLSLNLVKPAGQPDLIKSDQEKIRQVIINLLSNAVKFTTQGMVRLKYTVRRGEVGKWLLEVEVEDTGPGILTEEHTRIFEKFEQAQAGYDAQTGTGLGLSISRQYARFLGGELTVRSRFGHGSVFQMLLPVALAEKSRPAPATDLHAWQLAPGVPPIRALIVDDVEDNRKLLQIWLQGLGFETRAAGDGLQAVAAFQAWQPHLILMDVRMPDMDGHAAIRQIRTLPGGTAVKILTVTAATYLDDKNKAFEAGADDFLAKPLLKTPLLKKIRELLAANFMAAPAAPAAPAEPKPFGMPPFLSRLAAIPPALRMELKTALVIADFTEVNKVIGHINLLDPLVGQHLFRLAERFQAETLLQMLEATHPPAS